VVAAVCLGDRPGRGRRCIHGAGRGGDAREADLRGIAPVSEANLDETCYG